MPALSDTLPNVTVPSDSTSLEAAAAVRDQLKEAGHNAMVLDKTAARTGLALVHASGEGDDHIVLVHSGDDASLREALRTLTKVPLPTARTHVVSSQALPGDVSAIYRDGLLREVEHAMSADPNIEMDLLLSHIPMTVQRLRPALAEKLDSALDLDGGRDTLAAIDAAIDKLRPAEAHIALDNAAIYPMWTITALGLVASETVRRLAGRGTYGQVTDGGSTERQRLADSHGSPTLQLDDFAQFNAAQTLIKRWYSGSSVSLAELWDSTAAALPHPPTEEEWAALVPRFEDGIRLAAEQVAAALARLGSGETSVNSVHARVGDEVVAVALPAESPLNADDVVEEALAAGAPDAEMVVSVLDAHVTPMDSPRTDALIARAHVPKQPGNVVIAVPYALTDGKITHAVKPILMMASVPGLSTDRISELFYEALGTSDIPRPLDVPEVTTMLSNMMTGAMSASVATLSDDHALHARKLAVLAPFAGFLMVASADGEVEEGELRAFADGMGKVEKRGLRMLSQAIDVEPLEAVALLVANTDLTEPCLAAAGWLFDNDDAGGQARDEFLELMESVASGGEARGSEEMMALALIRMWLASDVSKAVNTPLPPLLAEADINVGAVIEQAVMAMAGLAPFGAMLMVAAADGEVEDKEIEAFTASLARMDDPLLRAMLQSHDLPPSERVEKLRADPDLVSTSLMAAGAMFRNHPEGAKSQEAFLTLLRDTAAAHGELRDIEREVIEEVERLLNKGPEKPWFPRAVFGGILLFGLVFLWQFTSAAVGLTGIFVPVAVALQAGLLLLWLFITSLSQGYVRQVLIGSVASVGAGIGLAMSSVVVSALFPSAVPAGSSIMAQAVAGLLGTAITGVVLSVLIGLVFRKRD